MALTSGSELVEETGYLNGRGTAEWRRIHRRERRAHRIVIDAVTVQPSH